MKNFDYGYLQTKDGIFWMYSGETMKIFVIKEYAWQTLHDKGMMSFVWISRDFE